MRRSKTLPPDRLMPEQRERIRAWVQEKCPQYESRIGYHWQECRDWHLKNGVDAVDWEAAFRMWLRKAAEFSRREGRPPDRPRRTSVPTRVTQGDIGDVLSGMEVEGEA